MQTTAVPRGGDFIVNGTKHFISHADHADFVILFAATGEEESARGKRKLISAFLVDTGTPGFEIRPGYQNVSHRGYTNSILQFSDCRLPKSAVLGELQRGFELANTWLGATRLQVAANCLGRAQRALREYVLYPFFLADHAHGPGIGRARRTDDLRLWHGPFPAF